VDDESAEDWDLQLGSQGPSSSRRKDSSSFYNLSIGGEMNASPDVGSTSSLDKLSEDVNVLSINHPSGFMGKGTDISWLRGVQGQLDASAMDPDVPENDQLSSTGMYSHCCQSG
jgi:hypothetical protein